MESKKEDKEGKKFRNFLLLFFFCYIGVLSGMLLAMSFAHRSEALSDSGNIFVLLLATLLGSVFIPGCFALFPPIILLYRVDYFKKYQDTFSGYAIGFFLALILSSIVNKVF